MIGLIDCRSRSLRLSWAGVPGSTLEFFDAPVVRHAIEEMFLAGATHCVLITEDTAGMMQRWRNSERWGRTLSAIPPHAITIFLAGLREESLLVGRADCVPSLAGLLETHAKDEPSCLIYHRDSEDAGEAFFTGWARTYPNTLLENFFATQGSDGLLRAQNAVPAHVTRCIRTDTPDGLLESQAAAFAQPTGELNFEGMKRNGTVWTGRRVRIHPTARISGDVFLGDDVRIGRGAVLLGPVVVCRDSVIEADAVLASACVQPGMYVGRGTHLHHVVVVPGSILRARQGRIVKVNDPRVLARTQLGVFRGLIDYTRSLWACATWVERQPLEARQSVQA